MKMRILFLFGFFIFCGFSYSQVNVEFEQKSFPDQEKALSRAIRQIKDGDSYYMAEDFAKYLAIDYYLEANSFNPNNALLNFKIGYCYLLSPNKFKSLEYLKKAYQLNPTVDSNICYYLGQSFQINLLFDDAIKYYSLYLNVENKKEGFDPERRIKECKVGKRLLEKPVRAVIQNLGPIVNSKYSDHSPVITADESIMYFTSRRSNNTNKELAEDGKYYEDVFATRKKEDSWSAPKRLSYPVNSYVHDATIALSPDGQKLLLYSGENKGDILESRLDGDKWSKPYPAAGGVINSPFSELHAAYSYDEKSIYFVSNNPQNNFGGFDIFVTHLGPDGVWSKPENIGPELNTPGDEDGVFLQADGKTMYFSSDGHETMGASDIFKSVFENGKWSKPQNVGYPINSADKDAYFVISASGKKAYYSSARNDAIGETDIYRIWMLGPEKETILVAEDQYLMSSSGAIPDILPEPKLEEKNTESQLVIKGYTADSADGKPLNALIILTDLNGGEIISTQKANPLNGNFEVTFPSQNNNYRLYVVAEGYELYATKSEFNQSDNAEKTILLKKIINQEKSGAINIPSGFYAISGEVADNISGSFLPANIIVRDNLQKEIITIIPTNSKNGTFSFTLKRLSEISLTAMSEGYLSKTIKLNITKSNNQKNLVQNIKLEKAISENKTEKIENVTSPQNYTSEVTILKGKITDATSKNALNANLIITDIEKNEIVSGFESNSKTGEYLVALPSGRNYSVTVSAKEYLFYSENINLPRGKAYQQIIRDIELIKLQIGGKIILNNIFYKTNEAILQPQSKTELERLVKLLESNPTMRIEISSHTDNVGTASYNEKLSNERALEVVKYLQSKGINPSRLEYKGYGFASPIATNDTEQGRKMNRRTEFKIISK